MPKYLFQATYTPTGMKGVLTEGGTSRQNMIEKMMQSMGGTMEAFYFGFGSDDVFILADFPSNIEAVSVGMNVTATGAANVKTTVLLTPEEIDRATQRDVDYRPPGE